MDPLMYGSIFPLMVWTMYGPLISDKVVKQGNGEMIVFSTNVEGKLGYSHAKK